jgi:hypothetical protein
MMHRSRLCTVNIDCENADLEEAASFWSRALGRPVMARRGDHIGLEHRVGQPNVSVQRVAHASRMHLDIETDDVDAEVARLEALGARRIQRFHPWWVMEAPTGHRFCVAPPKHGNLAADANVWSPDE